MAVENVLLAGLQASYDALTPDSGKLYFCTDTMNMYKGADLYTDGIRVVSTDPTTPAAGKIYYNTTEDVLKTYSNGSWVTLRVAMASTVTSASTDAQIPTAAAVYEYVTSAIEDVTGSGAVVQSVVAGSTAGTLEVTTGGAASTVTVPGVYTSITYDSSTRAFTFTNTDGDTVTAELGKDIFVNPDADNGYDAESGNIVLYLNDGTEITIPASSLVDTYTGSATTTATTTVSNYDISVAVKLSTDANNAITTDSTGLLVDLSSYATTAAVESAVQAVQDDVDALEDRVAANEAAITLLNGDSTTEGSVAYAVAQATATLNAAIATAQSTAETAQDAADAAQSTADTNTESISDIESAWGFGSF